MKLEAKHTLAAFGAAALLALPGAAAAQSAEFTVRIENVSTEKTLRLSDGTTAPAPTSPGAWAVYRGAGNPIFAAGTRASAELEPQAEEGNPEKLTAALSSMKGVKASGAFAVPTGDAEAGPLLPGKSFEFRFTAQRGDRLALAFMFGQSNDLFYAPAESGIALFEGGRPVSTDLTSRLVLWHAGTERNQEPGLGADQAPRQKAPNTGEAENGVVRMVSDAFTYPATGEVIRVTITARAGVADAGR